MISHDYKFCGIEMANIVEEKEGWKQIGIEYLKESLKKI